MNQELEAAHLIVDLFANCFPSFKQHLVIALIPIKNLHQNLKTYLKERDKGKKGINGYLKEVLEEVYIIYS